jgi:hypothetical protein
MYEKELCTTMFDPNLVDWGTAYTNSKLIE